MPMSQKDRIPNIGSKTTIFGLLKPILSHNSQLLRDKLLWASDFAYIAANGFIGGLVFKYAVLLITVPWHNKSSFALKMKSISEERLTIAYYER